MSLAEAALSGGLAERVRDPRPAEVRVVTGDYRANRQHWVTVTRIERYPRMAGLHSSTWQASTIRRSCVVRMRRHEAPSSM